MHEQVHERAKQKQDVRQSTDQLRAVVLPEEEARNHEHAAEGERPRDP